MNTREQLAEVIRDGEGTWRTPLESADAILKALAPREVTTETELDALADGAVIQSDEGGIFEHEHGWWRVTGSRDPMASSEIALPVTVLLEGEA